MRRFRILTLLLVLGVVASACSTFSKPPAATIDGRELSTDSIDRQMSSILGNDKYASTIQQAFGFEPQEAEVDGAFSTAFAAQMVSLRVWFEVWERDIAERGEQQLVSDAEDQLREQIPGQIDAAVGPGTYDSFSTAEQREIVHQQAVIAGIRQAVTDQLGDAESYYDEHPEDFAVICVSHILVSTQGGKTAAQARSEAAKLRARIEDGESFEAIAANESDDPGSAAENGAVGCGSQASLQLVPEFEAVAFQLDVDEVSQPVDTQFGAHLIKVTKRTVPDFDEIDDIQTEMSGIGDRLFNDRLTKPLCDADVTVNPRYGRWTREGCDALVQSSLPRVNPPEGPIEQSTEDLQSGL
jgi:foldase protein PrsA